MKKILLAGCMVLILSGCSAGVSKEQYESAIAEAIEMSKEVGNLQEKLNEVQEQYNKLSEEYTNYKNNMEQTTSTESESIVESQETEVAENAEKPQNVASIFISELEFNGESVIDSTVSFMKQGNDIRDVHIEVDEGKKRISIVVQVPSSASEDEAKTAGEDVARYFASVCSWANSRFSSPGLTNLGGIYDSYDLLLYIDDGNRKFDIYGAKATNAKTIKW